MKLFFDTETTGLARFDLPSTHELQPRIVSIVGILANDEFKEIGCINAIVKPIGFTIPDRMTEIHGISHKLALDTGREPTEVFATFQEMVDKADTLIGHNIKFDKILIQREGIKLLNSTNEFCTMLAMTNICKIKKKNDYKWPKLQEAYTYCFGKSFEGAHNALNDVRACIEVYKWYKKNVYIGIDMAHPNTDKTVINPFPNPAPSMNTVPLPNEFSFNSV